MEISSQTNSYQALNTLQKRQEQPVTTPVEPQEPQKQESQYSSSEVYQASNGNAISNENGEVSLTSQGQNNLSNAVNDANTAQEQQTQEQTDALRGVAVDYVGVQSKQSQVEIYLSVASDSQDDVANSTPSILESLRDVQKQNNAVEAYATYKENQQGGQSALLA